MLYKYKTTVLKTVLNTILSNILILNKGFLLFKNGRKLFARRGKFARRDG